MRANRIDRNQPEIVRDVRRAGVVWIPTSGDPNIGFDGLLVFRGRVVPAEIKDPSKPPSARRLTDTEARRKAEIEGQGATYLVVETADDVLRYFGLITLPLRERVLELCAAGRTLDAIKLYRNETGAALRDSKDAVMALRAENEPDAD